MAAVTPAMFARAVLSKMGLPTSENNIRALVALAAQEGGFSANSAAFNPFNVTQPMPGSEKVTPIGVRAYKDWDQGIEATAKLLKNGLYPSVLASLKRSAPPEETLREIALSPFGWYEMRGGTRIPLPYPAALAVATSEAAYRRAASLEFPSGGFFPMLGSVGKTAGVVMLVGLGLAGVTLLVAKYRKSV